MCLLNAKSRVKFASVNYPLGTKIIESLLQFVTLTFIMILSSFVNNIDNIEWRFRY
jgi:hypothetical protein